MNNFLLIIFLLLGDGEWIVVHRSTPV